MLGLGVLVISIGFDFHFEWAPGLLACDCESRRTSQVPGVCVCACVCSEFTGAGIAVLALSTGELSL